MSWPRLANPAKLNAIAVLVALTGLITLSTTLLSLLHIHHVKIAGPDPHLTVLAGLSLIYLASLLSRGKYTAWLVSVPIYLYLVFRNLRHFVFAPETDHHSLWATIINLALPAITLVLLVVYRDLFNVRSEVRNFATAAQRSVIILVVAFVYALVGFTLMDQHDFHQEISITQAASYTVQQFELATSSQATPYTRRAHLFVDSLAAVSLGAIFYVGISLFSPIRFRLSHHEQDYEDIKKLIDRHSTTSEDFFMLWPHDKSYFFNHRRSAAIAYKAAGGVAMIVGDPIGSPKDIKGLMVDFQGFCRINDWRPALIHTESKNLELYRELGFEAQKIGEEAIIDTGHFVAGVATSKDFRHISNKFTKLGYQIEFLQPPYSDQTLKILRAISDDWLSKPGRSERCFMLGYFDEDYIQQCALLVAKDSRGVIQAFANQVPSPVAEEANFDFMRHSSASPGNINDFLMMNFIAELHRQKVKRLNMGLSALAGLKEPDESASALLNSFLSFTYANGNRFFSFKGLNRFKSKYEPRWEDRYIVYAGGITGFSKTLNALMRAMRVK